MKKNRERIDGDFGEAGAVFRRVAQAGLVGLDLKAIDLRRGGRGGVLADDVAAGEERVVARLRFLRAGHGADAALREKIAEAARAAEERRGAAADTGGEIAERAEPDEFGGVERFVRLVELLRVERIAELDACDRVRVPVHVDEKCEAVLRGGGAGGGFDKGVKLPPRFLGDGAALRGFDELAVRVELAAVELARDEVRAAAGARKKFVGDGAGEFLRVQIHVGHALRAVGNRLGAETSAVGRSEDDGQIAAVVFDEAVGAESDFGGQFFSGGGKRRRTAQRQDESGEVGACLQAMERDDGRNRRKQAPTLRAAGAGARPRWALR